MFSVSDFRFVFLDNEGKVTNKIEQQLFDTSKDLVIEDDDYGLWYIDAVDNAEKYDGCKITLKLKHLDTVKRPVLQSDRKDQGTG